MSIDVQECTGTEYWQCNQCNRLDFANKFEPQPKQVPHKYHQNVSMDKLMNKKMFAKGQYDQ